MPSPEQDIKFLEAYKKELQKLYILVSESGPSNCSPPSDYDLPTTDKKAERAARLADEYGLNGDVFRNLLLEAFDGFWDWLASQEKKLKKQIKIIPQIIAKIEKAVETVRDETNEPKDLIDLAKALTHVQISRTQIKRDIYKGKIKSYHKNPRGKHFVSLAEIQKVYLTK